MSCWFLLPLAVGVARPLGVCCGAWVCLDPILRPLPPALRPPSGQSPLSSRPVAPYTGRKNRTGIRTSLAVSLSRDMYSASMSIAEMTSIGGSSTKSQDEVFSMIVAYFYDIPVKSKKMVDLRVVADFSFFLSSFFLDGPGEAEAESSVTDIKMLSLHSL